MALTAITGNEHFHAALVKLVGPFWGRPRIASLLLAMTRRVQELEDAAWEVLEIHHIDNADTARLNVLGRIVGQPRFWADDEIYRAVIRAKIAANKSRTLTDDLINVIHIATGSTPEIQVHHYSPATMAVLPHEAFTEAEIEALIFLLPRTRSLGVRMHVFISHIDDGDYDYESTGIDLDDTTDPGSVDPGLFDVRIL
jgi:hypothetical protein